MLNNKKIIFSVFFFINNFKIKKNLFRYKKQINLHCIAIENYKNLKSIDYFAGLKKIILQASFIVVTG